MSRKRLRKEEEASKASQASKGAPKGQVRRQTTPKKTSAPENKMLPNVPENKGLVDEEDSEGA